VNRVGPTVGDLTIAPGPCRVKESPSPEIQTAAGDCGTLTALWGTEARTGRPAAPVI
jgi:hypothetical protein